MPRSLDPRPLGHGSLTLDTVMPTKQQKLPLCRVVLIPGPVLVSTGMQGLWKAVQDLILLFKSVLGVPVLYREGE